MSAKTKVIIVDDHELIRKGLSNLISKQKDMVVIGEECNGRDAINTITKTVPDVIIMDIAMPELNGVEASIQILKKHPEINIIALSMHSNHHFVHGMFKAGAKGYILKDCAVNEIVHAIRTVMSGKVYVCEEITGIIVQDFVSSENKEKEKNITLSEREKEILQLLAEGFHTKAIAEKLNLSVKTIETHRKNIQDKTGKKNLAELTKYAIIAGLTSLDN